MENEEAGQKDQKKHKSKRPIGKIALLVLLLVMVIFKEDLFAFQCRALFACGGLDPLWHGKPQIGTALVAA